ncbi:hypothetical protein EJ08DRAFT_416920 [Tothia fuscella]|uniref:Uncharacterized protein n=1 Tax=Tothia fuscella TaxID=1048955 RepID=A0A9P4NJJ0_9PEZI|nr:hypothetical protein EJ08DRAFT_416920 [Tothia fuscella]
MAHFSRTPVSFEDNAALEIDNPLIYQTPTELRESALAFAKRVSPHAPDERLWILAAQIAQDPLLARDARGQEQLNGLTKQEKIALRQEKQLGFWGQSKAVRVTIVTLCLSAVIQGWSQTDTRRSQRLVPWVGWRIWTARRKWQMDRWQFVNLGVCWCKCDCLLYC